MEADDLKVKSRAMKKKEVFEQNSLIEDIKQFKQDSTQITDKVDINILKEIDQDIQR